MNATIKLLDKYKMTSNINSDNACSVALGVSRQAVSKWRNEENHPDADSVEKMCDAINEPLRRWLPLIEAERARSPAVRKVWLRLAQAAATVAVTFGLLNVQKVSAQGVKTLSHNPAHTVYYVKLVRWFETVGTMLARALFPRQGKRNHEVQMAF